MPSIIESYKRRVDAMRRKARRHPNAIRILAEGDSWFTFGSLMWTGKSLIQELNEYRTLNIVSVANPAAELENLVEGSNPDWGIATQPDWLRSTNYQAVLFSGGGNDVVGSELKRYLKDKTQSGESGTGLVKLDVFQQKLDDMKAQFRTLRATVDGVIPPTQGRPCPIFIHGYDYAFPSGQSTQLLGGLITVGPWMQNNFIQRGIVDTAEQVQIVNFLVDCFNQMLLDLASEIPQFCHLELRNCLVRSDWADELHPNAGGRRKLAMSIRSQLTTVMASIQ